MGKIDDLIKKHCPNGVLFQRVDEVCDICRGKVMSKDYIRDNAGVYPVYSSQTENDGELGRICSFDFDGEYLTWTTDGANAGSVFYRQGKFSVTNVCGLLKVNAPNLLTKFLFYTLFIEAPKFVNKGMGNPKLMSNVMARIQIPVPPLEVQREIVQILDSFTMLTAELSAKLSAELSARKKQYEFYRDQLLSFKDDSSVEWKTLGEIATDIYRGSGITRDQVMETGTPCVRYGEIYTSYGVHFDKCISHTSLEIITSPKFFEYGDILFAITGESIEDIAKCTAYVGKEKCLAGGDMVVLKHNQNPKYLAYALSTTDAVKQKGKGKVKSKVVHSSVPAIKEIRIPLPSLAEQNRIVMILDEFNTLVNDISADIPAEIEARKKQYEYYRDKLLTFKAN